VLSRQAIIRPLTRINHQPGLLTEVAASHVGNNNGNGVKMGMDRNRGLVSGLAVELLAHKAH
jgi:hypothetical protein